jgi:hypothetical protein
VPAAATPRPAAVAALSPPPAATTTPWPRPSCAATAGRTAPPAVLPSTRRGMGARVRCVAASIASDHARRATSSHSVPAESDMSDTASPVNSSRTESFGSSTRASRRKTSGSCSSTHISFGAVKPGIAMLPVMRRLCGSRRSSSAHCAWLRPSFHRIAGAARVLAHRAASRRACGPTGPAHAPRRIPSGVRRAARRVRRGWRLTNPAGSARTTAAAAARSAPRWRPGRPLAARRRPAPPSPRKCRCAEVHAKVRVGE